MPKFKQFDEAAVLSKAQEVFSEKGYNGTSMDDLVKVTGLSRSSIYDTFGDKHGLYLKSLEQYRSDQQTALLGLLEKTASPRKKIHLLFESTIREIRADKKRLGCLMINASMEMTCIDKEITNLTNLSIEESEQRFYKWVKEGQAAGEITRKFSAKALARFLMNSFMGLRMTGRNRPDPDALRDILKLNLSILDNQ